MDQCDCLSGGNAGDLSPRIKINYLDGEKLDERRVIGVDGEEELERIDRCFASFAADAVRGTQCGNVEFRTV